MVSEDIQAGQSSRRQIVVESVSERVRAVWVLCDVCGSGEVLGVYSTHASAKDAEDAYWSEDACGMEDDDEERRNALKQFVLM